MDEKLTIRLNSELVNDLDRLAKELHVTRSHVIRDLLRNSVHRTSVLVPVGTMELLDDLIVRWYEDPERAVEDAVRRLWLYYYEQGLIEKQ
jgi:Arc/MetJ-type ribon-helix-helix transcriptional regulator